MDRVGNNIIFNECWLKNKELKRCLGRSISQIRLIITYVSKQSSVYEKTQRNEQGLW